jgi:DNA (cytosine-5)-methyltransferase 1
VVKTGFYEFFAGGGMARLGLGPRWRCLVANDISKSKAEAYDANFRDHVMRQADVADLLPTDIPPGGVLAWASFPCQDLSLAGNGAGLDARRSGCFWPFWRLVESLEACGRPVPLVTLENVVGLLHSKGGGDFSRLAATLVGSGYRFGAIVVDAVHFVPQSRPRLFIVCVRHGIRIPSKCIASSPHPVWHGKGIADAVARLPEPVRKNWIWWELPDPPVRRTTFGSIVERRQTGVAWHSPEQTKRLLNMMSNRNLMKVRLARPKMGVVVGTVYKRTRRDESGRKVQRAEVRFDGVGGCLRTPAGGSSRQTVLVVEPGRIRSRLLSPREAARLMGVRDSYWLPKNYNEAYHLMGDGLAVPSVAWVRRHILDPLASALVERGRRR